MGMRVVGGYWMNERSTFWWRLMSWYSELELPLSVEERNIQTPISNCNADAHSQFFNFELSIHD